MSENEETRPVTLSNLRPAPGSHRNRMRVGRGPGSGKGKTSGRGSKGHKARSGGSTNPGFEGGQMPMYRRLPKRGFTNPFKVANQVVNVRDLTRMAETEVTPSTLHASGLIAEPDRPVKLLGVGDADRAYTVRGLTCSATARSKVEAAGGTVET